jgi:hypothetical protein
MFWRREFMGVLQNRFANHAPQERYGRTSLNQRGQIYGEIPGVTTVRKGSRTGFAK